MRRLIFLELKLVLPVFVLSSVAITILTIFMKTSIWMWFLPSYNLLLAIISLRRSLWYLNLPWSRRRVAAVIIIQNCIIVLTGLLISFAVLMVLKHTILSEEISNFDFELTVWLTIFACVTISSCLVLTGKPVQRRVPALQSYFSKRSLQIYLLIIGSIGICWWLNLLIEPAVYWSVLVSLPFILLCAFCSQIVLPRQNFNALVKMSKLAIPILIFLPVASVIAIVNLGGPTEKLTGDAIKLLGRVPAFISNARAIELFKASTVSDVPMMNRHLATLRLKTDQSAWTDRTRKCLSGGCLDLSSDVADMTNLSKPETEFRFMTLMELCNLKLKGESEVRCEGPHLSSFRLNSWIALLNENGTLDQWLKGDDVIKQIIAIKGLSFNFSDDQAKRIRELSSAKEVRLATAAQTVISSKNAFLAMNLDCGNLDRDKKPCRLRKAGPYSAF